MSVCLVAAAKNEGPYLVEWIAHHRNSGFDRIVIYDNDSTDQSSELLAKLSRVGLVDHVDWVVPSHMSPQHSAYKHSLAEVDEEWVCFLDLDEFLVLHNHSTVGEFVEEIGRDAGAIAVNWRTFGSGTAKKYEPRPSFERFVHCSPKHAPLSLHVKSIVRKHVVELMRVHTCTFNCEAGYVNDRGLKIEVLGHGFSPYVSYANAQINHYIVRSQEEFWRKIERGRGASPANSRELRFREKPAEFLTKIDNNTDLDLSALEHTEKLHEEMNAMMEKAGLDRSIITLQRRDDDQTTA